MKTISLAFISPTGDELGLLPVADVHIAPAGETAAASRYPADQQMDELQRRIEENIQAAGLILTVEPLDLQITLARALLQQMDQNHIIVPIPVNAAAERSASPSSPPSPDTSAAADAPPLADADGSVWPAAPPSSALGGEETGG